jgi:multidrug efflux pump subunit AcrA (membrane-fusion protein)
MKALTKPNIIKNISTRINAIIEKRPLLAFSIALALVVGVIATGSALRAPKQEATPAKPVKKVAVYKIGTVPTMRFQGQVEKSGTTTVVALTGGIVQRVSVRPGQKVGVGQTLVSLSQNYQGGNAASVSRQIAQKQRDLAFSTYDQQIEAINKQRDLANENADNAAQMRDIAGKAASDTQSVLDLNNDIINSLQSSVDLLAADPASNSATLIAAKQFLAQFKGTNAQLQSGLRNSQYQAGSDNPPAELAQTQKDLALKQLDIQQQSLTVSRDISDLSLKVAQINEAMFYPASPYNGVIQRVFVHPGQFVAPGTPLVAVAGGAQTADIVVSVPQAIAQNVSKIQPSIVKVGQISLTVTPAFISTEAIAGNQHVITYHVTGADVSSLTDKSFVTVEIPVGNPDTVLTETPVIPIDSIFQTENKSTVFVVRDGKAVSVDVKLGGVLGDYARVESGIASGDHVILDRSVLDNDPVEE